MIVTPAWFKRDVSRETLERLGDYCDLLRRWTAKINLVAPSTLPQLETRHIWDSAQIFEGDSGSLADLGSGGGLPGIVLAVLRAGDGIIEETVLIESDQRKATFLRTCGRELNLKVRVMAKRIEMADPQDADVVTARALASLSDLLGLASRHLADDGHCVFLKGANWQSEIRDAEQNWRFSYTATPSKTLSEAAILRVRDISRV